MDDMTSHKAELLQSKKIVLYWLLGFIYSSFIGLQLGRIQAIADFNYNLHELMYLPINLAIFVVPVLFLIYLYLFIRTIKIRRIRTFTIKTTMKSILTTVSLIAVFSIVGYQFQEVTTTGSYILNQKVQEDSKYYVLLDDIKIRVSRNEYNLVQGGEKYMIVYRWNKNSPHKGNLEYIESILD